MITNRVVMELSDKFIEDLRKLGYSAVGAYILSRDGKEHTREDILSHDAKEGSLIGCLSIDWADLKYLFMDDTRLNVYALASKENAENIPFLKMMRREGVKFYNLKVFQNKDRLEAEMAGLLHQKEETQFLMMLPLEKIKEDITV